MVESCNVQGTARFNGLKWNMSIRNAGIGPQCYGRRSDAVVCVYSGKAGRFADIFDHVCEVVDAKWPLLEPHVIFRTEICLWILKKRPQFGLIFST